MTELNFYGARNITVRDISNECRRHNYTIFMQVVYLLWHKRRDYHMIQISYTQLQVIISETSLIYDDIYHNQFNM